MYFVHLLQAKQFFRHLFSQPGKSLLEIPQILLFDTSTILLNPQNYISAVTAISDVKVATIVGTATNPWHPYDGTHGGLTDGNDLDGTPNGGCSSKVR